MGYAVSFPLAARAQRAMESASTELLGEKERLEESSQEGAGFAPLLVGLVLIGSTTVARRAARASAPPPAQWLPSQEESGRPSLAAFQGRSQGGSPPRAVSPQDATSPPGLLPHTPYQEAGGLSASCPRTREELAEAYQAQKAQIIANHLKHWLHRGQQNGQSSELFFEESAGLRDSQLADQLLEVEQACQERLALLDAHA